MENNGSHRTSFRFFSQEAQLPADNNNGCSQQISHDVPAVRHPARNKRLIGLFRKTVTEANTYYQQTGEKGMFSGQGVEGKQATGGQGSISQGVADLVKVMIAEKGQ